MYQSPPLPYLHIFLAVTCIYIFAIQKCLEPGQDTKSAIFLFLKENVCNGYSLEAALSSVNAVHLYLIGSHAKMFKLQSRKL